MASKTSVTQPAYVLHSYDWSESSVILELLTADMGRVAVVAKGAKKPTSNFRPVLLPLQPIVVQFKNVSQDLAVLQSAKWTGGKVMPAGANGDRLLAGCYVNELLLRLLPRQDACSLLFGAYAQFVELLHSSWESAVLIRALELFALQQLGHLPALGEQYNGQPLQQGQAYVLEPEWGLCIPDAEPIANAGGMGSSRANCSRIALESRYWQQLQQALSAEQVFQACLQVLHTWQLDEPAMLPALRKALHPSIQHHSGREQLRTRRLMMDMMEF